MVYDSLRRRYSSTFDCACGTGCIDDVVDLNQQQLDWLDRQQAAVDEAFNISRAGMPEYS
jgi:hypothetical protein